ncbi:hypothetical protein ABZ736_21670 [Streptomyces sp. NPDC013099]|uniref:hypothetical protein n=1 Tax=Streptomyces sp. NPDC013099 TaxID=3156687 RepID=UPI0033E47C63
MPVPKKRTPAKTAVKKPAVQPVPPVPPSGPLVGTLCGQEVEMLPLADWRSSAMKALQEGDLDTWAEHCLTDDGLDVWEDNDPTFREIGEFFASFSDEMAAQQTDLTGNRAARRARRRT